MNKKFLTLLAAVLFLSSTGVAFAAPWDIELNYRDKYDSTDLMANVTPSSYDDGVYSLLAFRGNGYDSGTPYGGYHFVPQGSGVDLSGGFINVTPDTIETSDGHLSNTISYLKSNLAAATSTIAGLSSPGPVFSMTSFVANQASTTPLVASSTSNGFMSSTSAATMANLKTVATTGAYGDLTGKPSLFSGAWSDLTGKPDIGVVYEGTTKRTGAFPIFKSVTISSGTGVVNITSDGTSGGTALCANGPIMDSVSIIFNDATASFQQSWAWSNSNKTLTVTANKFTTANILSGILGQAAANTSVAKITVWCY